LYLLILYNKLIFFKKISINGIQTIKNLFQLNIQLKTY
jgi:hypothetical protein